MSIWAAAGAAIDRIFADPTPIVYTGAGLAGVAIPAIVINEAAPSFEGEGHALRMIIYEVAQATLPARPSKHGDAFTHRGRSWKVENVTERDDIGKWQLTVSDQGPAPAAPA